MHEGQQTPDDTSVPSGRPQATRAEAGLRSDNLQAYLPGDRRRALAEGRVLADRVRGAAIFVDISGFTPLTEALAIELGPQRGAEELTAALDAVFGPLLTELDRYGGDVIYFSGDAVTAWIDGDDGQIAVACAFAMQRVMAHVGLRTTPSGREVRIGLKVAVAVGSARRFVVGDPDVQLIDVLAGALMDQLADAEHCARQGEVVLDAGAIERLGERVVLGERRGEHGVAVVADLAAPVTLPPPRSPLPALPVEVVRTWLLPRVYERMSAGQGEFLAELRPGVPLFMHFAGIDYDNDPDATTKLDDLIIRTQRIVATYGGNVLQLTIGDKGAYLYAIFGAPVTHENDAARACASALELLTLEADAAVTGLQIGVAAGRLRSGTYGHPERRTFCCLGDAVNLAARLMMAAPAGSAYVSADVRQAAESDFRWGAATQLRVAGKSAEVVMSPLLGRRRTASRKVLGRPVASALIGRADELEELQARATEAMDGQGQVVVVTGPGGIGKTRLLAELARWLTKQGVRIRTGAAPSYGARTTYGVWQDLCRDAWGIRADASVDAVVERLEEVLGGVDSRLLPRLPLLGPLLGVVIPDTMLTASFDAKLRKTSVESLVVQLLTANAARGPIAFLIDAAEHMDELSWDMVDAIGRLAPRVPVLVVLARRAPSADESFALFELPQVHEIILTDLDGEASRELVETRLRAHTTADLPSAVLERLTTLAGGNPFHLEELVNHMVDRGIDPAQAAAGDISLPTSLHNLQLARIDDLAESPRRTLKVASVVGERFEVNVIAGSYPELGDEPEVGEYTLTLTAAALVIQEGSNVYSYAFRNAATQQVAYETLTYASRSALHGRVLSWLEAHALGGPEAILDVLAYHAARGTDDGKKRDYLVRAGVAAQSRYANDAAVDYFTTALPLVDVDERPELRRRLGKVLEIAGRWAEAEQAYRDAAAHYEQRGDERGRANAQTDLAEVARKQGRFDDARQLLAHANDAFVAVDDQAGIATVLHLQGTLASQQSRYDDARAAYERSLEIRRELGDTAKIGALLSNLAVVAEQIGDYDRAWELNESALAMRQEVGDPWAIAVSQNNLGMIALLQEDFARATDHIAESMRLADQVGDRWIVAVGQHNLGIAQRGLARYAASGEAYLAALQAYVDYNDRWSLALLVEDVTFLAVDTGQDRGALQLLGAADALRTELEAPRPPALAQLLDAALAPVRDRLGPSVADEVQAGRRLELADAAELIRAVCRLGEG
ncbi:MAG: hypothetical protein QOF87_1321 [Pseudonocardiales bacterium]|nr:hypothetical protein [Pseudonocardiales bacterium]